MKEIFKKEGLISVRGDETFYFQHKEGRLIGMIMTHIDDFGMAGIIEFLGKI